MQHSICFRLLFMYRIYLTPSQDRNPQSPIEQGDLLICSVPSRSPYPASWSRQIFRPRVPSVLFLILLIYNDGVLFWFLRHFFVVLLCVCIYVPGRVCIPECRYPWWPEDLRPPGVGGKGGHELPDVGVELGSSVKAIWTFNSGTIVVVWG